jgi:hypothetical protein
MLGNPPLTAEQNERDPAHADGVLAMRDGRIA